jgi:hypothetical protein
VPRTKEELIDNLMDEHASFILGNGAGYTAGLTIRELLAKALLDEEVFKSTWKKFFREDE